MRRRRRTLPRAGFVLCACAVVLACARGVRAADPPPPDTDDVDVIEFLGSVGSDDDAWLRYLAQTDARKTSTPQPKSPSPPDGSKQND